MYRTKAPLNIHILPYGVPCVFRLSFVYYIRSMFLCMWDFLSATKLYLCVHFNCTTAVYYYTVSACLPLTRSCSCSLSLSLFVSRSFVSVLYTVYDGIPFLSIFLLLSNFNISSHSIIIFFSLARSLSPSRSVVRFLIRFILYVRASSLSLSKH